MTITELLSEIERLRTKMADLYSSGANYNDILSVSQELDKLIVKYQNKNFHVYREMAATNMF